MLVHVIADYGQGDLAFAEVAQRLKLVLPEAELVLTPVPPFATLAAGFCIAQLGLNQAPEHTLIYHNIAPRRDDDQARVSNAGERLAFARLPTGVLVIGVCAGWTFSFVREAAEELRWSTVSAEGSQFRSRDLFPAAVADIARGVPGALGESLQAADLPAIPERRIAYVDGYGNLKTTIRAGTAPIENGARITVRIGGSEREALVTDGTFAVKQGQLAFAPGSSGWTENGLRVRWMELFLRGGSAWQVFNQPPIGAAIEL